ERERVHAVVATARAEMAGVLVGVGDAELARHVQPHVGAPLRRHALLVAERHGQRRSAPFWARTCARASDSWASARTGARLSSAPSATICRATAGLMPVSRQVAPSRPIARTMRSSAGMVLPAIAPTP